MGVKHNIAGSRPTEIPDAERIRRDAIVSGGFDPSVLRFRVVEYEKATGERLRVPLHDAGFWEAIEKTRALIERNDASHFCLEPIGFLQ